MLFFVHAPSVALHFATAACSAPSCSGLPPVPRPTNHRMRILPSEVRPPAGVGAAVMSAPVGRAVACASDGATDDGAPEHAADSTAVIPIARMRQCLCIL